MKVCPACAGNNTHRIEYISGFRLNVCNDCGLWFHAIDQERAVDYDAIYQTSEYKETHLASLFNTSNWLSFANYPTYQPFFDKFKPEAGALLDVGCGVGRFCRAAYAKGWRVRGIDVSRAAIAIGRKDVPFSLAAMTIKEMAENDEKFDVITAFEVMEHLREPKQFIDHVKKILKPGGKFFCTVPNIESPSVRTSNRKDWLPPVHTLFFNSCSLKALLLDAGLIQVETGEIWINVPPKGLLWRLKYSVLRALGRIGRPEPLGVWAVATLAETR